jgi:hypothetical protein
LHNRVQTYALDKINSMAGDERLKHMYFLFCFPLTEMDSDFINQPLLTVAAQYGVSYSEAVWLALSDFPDQLCDQIRDMVAPPNARPAVENRVVVVYLPWPQQPVSNLEISGALRVRFAGCVRDAMTELVGHVHAQVSCIASRGMCEGEM